MVGESLIFLPISIQITFMFHQKHILMFFFHLKPGLVAIGAGGGDRGGISFPPFSLPGGNGGEGEFYPDEFSNIKTKIIVNLKPKVRVIGAEEWTAVVTLHTPHPRRGGRGTSSGGPGRV